MAWFTKFDRCSERGGTRDIHRSATCDDDCPHCVRGTCRCAVPAPWSRPATRSFLIDAGRGATIRPYQLKLRIGRIDVQFLTHYPLRPHLGRAGRVAHRLATGPQARSAPDACWCRPGRRPRSGRRQQACAADRPAAPCSSTPSSCHQVCSAWRAAPQAPPGDQQGDLFWAKRIGSWKCSASPGRGSMPG